MPCSLIAHYPSVQWFLQHKPPTHPMVITPTACCGNSLSLHMQSSSLLVENHVHTAHKWRQSDYCAKFVWFFFFSFVILMTKVRQALHFNDKSPKKVTNSLINLNTHYSRYPPSLKALEMAVEFVCSILDEIKWRTYYLKDDNVKLWVEVIIAVTLLEAGATVDHLKAIITWSLWNSNCTFFKSKVFEKKHTTTILDIKSPHTP